MHLCLPNYLLPTYIVFIYIPQSLILNINLSWLYNSNNISYNPSEAPEATRSKIRLKDFLKKHIPHLTMSSVLCTDQSFPTSDKTILYENLCWTNQAYLDNYEKNGINLIYGNDILPFVFPNKDISITILYIASYSNLEVIVNVNRL